MKVRYSVELFTVLDILSNANTELEFVFACPMVLTESTYNKFFANSVLELICKLLNISVLDVSPSLIIPWTA